MKFVRKNFLLILLLILITACSKATSSILPTQSQAPEQGNQYPDPQSSVTESLEYPYPESNFSDTLSYPPAEQQEEVLPYPIPTIDPQLGRIQGRLLENNNPIPNMILYLAEVMKDSNGNDLVAGLDRVNSPSTETDAQGNFIFINITEGRYALILDIITNQFLLNYPGSENPIILQVDSGSESNLGDLNYDDLPIP